MTPQYIMEVAGRVKLAKSVRPDGSYIKEYPDQNYQWDTLEAKKRRMLDAVEYMTTSSGYAEPGYQDPSKEVLFADWNPFDSRLRSILKNYGYAIEWEDEWSTCGSCGKAVRTQPDSYSWQPSYAIINECEIVCNDCLIQDKSSMEAYLLEQEDNPRRCVHLTDCDPSEYGYRLIEAGFESGWYPGQNDDPAKITQDLRSNGVKTPLLFKIDDTGQFDIGFSVWTREESNI